MYFIGIIYFCYFYYTVHVVPKLTKPTLAAYVRIPTSHILPKFMPYSHPFRSFSLAISTLLYPGTSSTLKHVVDIGKRSVDSCECSTVHRYFKLVIPRGGRRRIPVQKKNSCSRSSKVNCRTASLKCSLNSSSSSPSKYLNSTWSSRN